MGVCSTILLEKKVSPQGYGNHRSIDNIGISVSDLNLLQWVLMRNVHIDGSTKCPNKYLKHKVRCCRMIA